MIIHNCEQRSDEWKALRCGRFTGSDFATFMGKGETKKRLLMEKATERIIGHSEKKEINNENIQRGVELEHIARCNYEMETMNKVVEVGFIEKDEYVGCSPDGLVGDDGMIEIKCPTSSVFVKHLLDDSIENQYYIQIQFNLYVSGRKWCDFVRYNENFDLYIKRVYADEECQREIAKTLDECIEEVKKIVDAFKRKETKCQPNT